MIALVFAGLCLTAPGCRQRAYPKAPYARASAPALETLLRATAPRFSKLRVPKAKVREGRSPGARLLLLAEAPGRMLGTIQVAGNPLLSLALNEQAYGLRTVRDTPALRSGFYEGPPSRCAVASLLGVNLEVEQVVALLLGGGPLIDGPHELVDQSWHKGRERVVIRNANYEQVLDFAWVDSRWWFAGARLYALGNAQPQWLWTIEHAELEGSGAKVLPTKTKIRRPNGPKDKIELTISYAKQVATPFATAEGGPAGEAGEDGEDAGDAGDEETGDPGWTDEGWDDDDEGWEGDEASQDGTTPLAPEAPEAPPEPDPIPAAYILQANGLPHRGDLCRR